MKSTNQSRQAIFEVFPIDGDKAKGFSWRVKRGARVIAVSAQLYARRRAATRSIQNFAEAIGTANFRVEILG